MMKSKALIVLFAAFAMYSCGTTKTTDTAAKTTPPTEEALANGYWELVRMAGVPAIKTPAEGERKIGFAFNPNQNQINGFAGCNNFFGSYVRNGSEITFSKMGSTKMACVRNVINEQEYFEKFSQANKLKLDDNLLTLLDSTNNVLAVFKHAANDGMANATETTEE